MSSAKPLALLTGATGFVGAQVLESLVNSLYRVIAPVCSPKKAYQLQSKYATQLSSKQLALVTVPDSAAPHALDDTLKDFPITFIVRLASPYFTTTNNPIEELVQPAVRATHNVMLSALTYGSPSLERLTLLSSSASVVDLSRDPRAGYTYTSDE